MVRGSQAKGSATIRRFTDEARSIDTVIGADARLEGKLRGNTNVEISGEFEGEIDVSGLVWLRPGGKISADLKATDVVLEGEASGKFIATNKIDIRVSAHVEGEITSNTIAMAEGSIFEGTITMAGEGGDARVVKYKEKRSSGAAPNTPEKTDS